MLEPVFNKVEGLKTCNFIKKLLQHRHFPVKFAKFLRTLILKNICERLLLSWVIWKFLSRAIVLLKQFPPLWSPLKTVVLKITETFQGNICCGFCFKWCCKLKAWQKINLIAGKSNVLKVLFQNAFSQFMLTKILHGLYHSIFP